MLNIAIITISHSIPSILTFAKVNSVELGPECIIGGKNVPAVIVKSSRAIKDTQRIIQEVCATQMQLKEYNIEGLQLVIRDSEDLSHFLSLHEALHSVVKFFVLELSDAIDIADLEILEWPKEGLARITIVQRILKEDSYYAASLLEFSRTRGFICAIDCTPEDLYDEIGSQLKSMGSEKPYSYL